MKTRVLKCTIVAGAVSVLLSSPALTLAQGTCDQLPAQPGGEFESSGVRLLGWVTLQDFDDTRASDIWAYVSPSGREYALIGLQTSFGVVEVTDPTSPVIVGQIPGPPSCWRDIKVHGEFAYGVIGSSGDGMQIIDLSAVDDGIVTLAKTSTFSGFADSHNIALNPESGFAYLCIPNLLNGAGLIAVDIRDPLNPKVAGQWRERQGFFDVRTHDALIVNYHEGKYAGREIAFIFSEQRVPSVYIIDVTDKKNMFTLSAVAYPNSSYTHQGSLSEDRRYLFVDDEIDEENDPDVKTTTTYVIDVEDLENAKFLLSFTNGLESSDHNLMVRRNLLFEANYTSGLRVFDISDVNTIHEVGFFDTYPAHDLVGNSGVGRGPWGVYTMLPSESILVSDRNRGLFIFDASELECGNGSIEPRESCDTGIAAGLPGACPDTCDDGDPCTDDVIDEAGTCNAVCESTAITEPADDDGCCPPGADGGNDNDCAPVCGDGKCEPPENEADCAQDCPAVCANGVCEPSESAIGCPADCPCADASECNDEAICTFDQCVDTACSLTPNVYGDANHDDTVDILDIFCVLDGFRNIFDRCSLADLDIAGCAPNGDVDILDIFAVLDAFRDIDPCCSNEP